LSDALAGTGEFFPRLFREMVAVGEESGHLPEVFRQLSEHYKHQLQLRRIFLRAITWPVVQLGMALAIIGFLIWIMGVISAANKAVDVLGFGLVGTSGLIRYLAVLAVVATAFVFIFAAVRKGLLSSPPVQRVVMRIPQLGRALETLALARLAWSMHLTMAAGMELRRALALSLASTQNVRYTSHTDGVLAAIRSGREIHEAFRATGVFPPQFLDAIEVGEQSGRLVESLARLSDGYQEEARSAMQTFTTLAGFAVWAAVALLIIAVIFRLFGFYAGAINDAVKFR
jgi:type IV pilus assembly protein PilC